MATRVTSALTLALATAIFGCGPSGSHHGDDTPIDAPSGPHELTAIIVTPTNAIVELDLNQAGLQDFQAIGSYADGTTEDLTPMVTWNVANPAVGAMTGATLQIPAFPAATAVNSKLTATYNGFTGLGQVTIVAYRQSGTQQDFFFVLPFNDGNGPMMRPLNFTTSISAMDVFMLMDTTGSMTGEIANLQSGLSGTVIPGIQASVTDSQFGVGAMEDFPLDPYGSSVCGATGADQPLKLLQTITNNAAAVQNGVSGLSNGPGGSPIGCGNDTPEGGIESIYQVATGEGLSGPSPTNIPPNHTGIGGVGFRQGTMPVIVGISDAVSHGLNEPGSCSSTGEVLAYSGAVATVAHSRQQTKDAMNAICARFVGIAAIPGFVAQDCTAQPYFEDLATATGARVAPSAWDVGVRPAGCAATQCCTDTGGVGRAPDVDGLCPVVFRVSSSGTGLGASVVTGIQMLTRFATFDVNDTKSGVTTDDMGNPLPNGHNTADFLKSIVPATYVLPPPPPVIPPPTLDATEFHGVTPGTTVGFQVQAFNDFVPQTNDAQIFRANIQVLASGCTPLDQRDVLILVPPTPIVIQ